MTVNVNDTIERDIVSGVGPYPFSFRIFAETDLQVTACSAATPAVPTLLTYLTHYTVTGANVQSGGSLTLTAPAAATYAGYTLDIRSNTPESQPTSIRNIGRFLPEIHEDAYDNLSRQIQDLRRMVNASIRYPDNVLNDGALSPISAWVSKYLTVDSNGVLTPALLTSAGSLTQAILSGLLFPAEVGETGVVNTLYRRGHVLRYGTNSIPGTTDMTAAFQNAALSSLNPYAPTDTFKITGTIPIRAGQKWELNNAPLNIASSTLEVFTATTVDDWSIDGLNIVGDGSTVGTAKGVKITDCRRWRINKPTLRNIRGWGIYSLPGASTTFRGEHGAIESPDIDQCYIGYEDVDGTGAEYCSINNPRIRRTALAGLITSAGNVLVHGGHIIDNVLDGVIVQTGGSNPNHGGFYGVNINHNGQFGLKCSQVLNGETFQGCHFYQNSVFLDRCKGILIDGGVIDCLVFNYKDGSSGTNIIRAMYCPGGYGFRREQGSNNGHDQLIIEQCFGPGAITDSTGGVDPISGISTNDAYRLYVFATRQAGANQALTSGVSATLIFPSEVYDRRLSYDNTTGITTIQVTQSGMYYVKAKCLFGGTAMSAIASFIDIQVNSVSTRLALPTIFGTTKLVIDVNEEIYLTAGDTVKLVATITGTTPVFGDATWHSALSIGRLA